VIVAALAKIRNDSFFRNVGILTGGTIGARAILVLSLPLLTRLFSPADFEMLAVYMASLSLVVVIASLRLNMAITLPAEDTEAANLLALALLAAGAISLVVAVAVIVAPTDAAKLLGQPDIQPYLWMIPAGIVVAAWYQALQYWASRKRRFALVARTRVTRAIGGTGTQIGFGLAGIAPFGLLLGHLVYSGLGTARLMSDLMRNERAALSGISPTAMLRAFSKYRRFPIYSVPEALANSAGMQVPVILIAAVAAGPEAGYLALAMQVMAIPMALVGQSVAQVFIVEAPERMRAGTLSAFTRRTSLTLFKMGLVVLIPVGLLAPMVFPFVFGVEWGRAGEIVLWMTPWYILQFTASPVSTVLHVTGHLRRAMVLQFVGGALRIGAVIIAAAMAVGWISEAYALSGAVFYALYICVVLKTVGERR